jgi:hypothetical protein
MRHSPSNNPSPAHPVQLLQQYLCVLGEESDRSPPYRGRGPVAGSAVLGWGGVGGGGWVGVGGGGRRGTRSASFTVVIMFRIGARIVAAQAKNGAPDALRGTQHLLTQAGRDILAAQFQAGYGAGAQVPRPPPRPLIHSPFFLPSIHPPTPPPSHPAPPRDAIFRPAVS